MKKALVLIVVGLSLSLSVSLARTWTQASTGKTLEGELTRINGEKILIMRSNGSSLELPIAMLTDADKQFIAEWQKEKAGAPSPAGGSGEAVAMEIPEGETKLVLSGVHMVCEGCTNAIEGSLGSLAGVEISTGRDKITIEAESGELVKTAMGYVMQRGFYGKPSIEAFADNKKYSDEKKESLTVSRLPLYCGKCVDEVEEVLEDVEGLKEIEGLERGAREVIVKGEVSQADVMKALHEAGMHAQVR